MKIHNTYRYLGFLILLSVFLSSTDLCAREAEAIPDSIQIEQKSLGDKYLEKCSEFFYTNADSMLIMLEKAFDYSIKNNDQSLLANCYNYRGIYLEASSEYSEALIQYNEAFNIAKALNDSLGIASFVNNIAGIHVVWGDFETGLDNYLRALSIYRSKNDRDGIATIYNNLGVLYDYQEDYVLALDYYEKALAIYREIESKEGISNALNNIGLIHFYNKDYTKARDHFIKSLSYDFERNNKPGIAISFGNIGDLYFEMEELSTARQYYDKALDLYVEIDNQEGIARVKNQLGSLKRKEKNYPEAEKLYMESIKIAYKINVIEVVLDNLDQLHQLYFDQKKYNKAYIAQKDYFAIKDSIFSLDKQERLNQLQTQYDYEKHIHDIELLQDKSELANMALQQQKLKNQQQRGILYAVMIIVIVVAYFLLHSARNNKKIFQSNMDLKTKNEEIEAAKNELLAAKEKAEESDRLKSSFLANMSHEIRTPMNSILGFSELLAEENINMDEKLEYIGYIKSSGKTLLTLINDIIDLAKIEAGQVSIKIYPTNINMVFHELEEYYSELKKSFGKEHVVFNCKTGLPDKEASILTDPERFRQIMINLLSNAMKFTESGSITFGYKKDANDLIFYVKDTGIGIKEKNLTLIFDHFRQIDESHTRKFGGTGLGLTISRNLTEMLGGKIWAESKPNNGSTFYFTLPYNAVKDNIMEESTMGDNRSNTPDLKEKMILVAEDEDSNFFLMKTQLRNSGVTLLRAKTGIEAIEIHKVYKEQIDLILMDIQMPEMNGYDAMMAIKENHKDCIIIAQTAHAMADERKQIKDAGFDDYLPKPITKQKFNALLKKYL